MASIRDIAKIAGVSPATVSRVLNKDESFSVSEATKQKIFKIAKEHNYTRSNSNRLVKTNTPEVNIIVISALSKEDERNDPYFGAIRLGLEEQATHFHISQLKFTRISDDNLIEIDLEKYNALILIGSFTEDTLSFLYNSNPNLVVIDDYRYFNDFDVIRNDFEQQTKQILQSLKQQGHKRIAFIGGKINTVDLKGKTKEVFQDIREIAYREWMSSHDLPLGIFNSEWTIESGIAATKELLASDYHPSALITANDPLAIGAYRVIQQHGLKIPEDISIVSFDDISVSAYLVPSLSSVHPPSEEMGREAIRLILERILFGRTTPVQIILPSHLIRRESFSN